MLAAGTKPESKAGLIHDNIADNEQYNADGDKNAQLQVADFEQKSLVGVADFGGSGAIEILGKNDCNRSRQHIESRAANCLIGLQIDGRKGQQQRIKHSCECRRRNGSDDNNNWCCALGQTGGGQNAGQTANDHDAFQRNIDDAGMFAEHSAQRNQHQNNAIEQRIFDEKQHITCPPSRFRFWVRYLHWRSPCRFYAAVSFRSRRGTAWRMHTGR